MLTQDDLIQIKTVVEGVVDNKFKQELKPINDRLNKIDNKLDSHDKEFKIVHKQLNKIQKDLTVTINYFDNNSRDHEKRIEKIERNIELSQLI